MSAAPSEECLRRLSEDYFDLNGSYIETLDAPPSALEFSRLVHVSRPVVITGHDVPPLTRWSDEYLVERMGEQRISIAATPNGRADAVTRGPDNKLYFAEPHVEKMAMSTFLDKLSTNSGDVLYLQSQNGNVYTNRTFQGEDDPSEFEALRADIPKDVPWCTEAIKRSPDAVNLWIGDGRSVTSIHSDPYENIYTVIRGQKHFILLPPTDGWCMRERSYPHARYIRPTPDSPLILQPSQGAPPVRWASIPDPSEHPPPSVHPFTVTLNAGDTLYLPAGWWHHVRQSGLTIALNWWYDLEMRGMTWALLSFLRGSEEVPDGNDESGDDGECAE